LSNLNQAQDPFSSVLCPGLRPREISKEGGQGQDEPQEPSW